MRIILANLFLLSGTLYLHAGNPVTPKTTEVTVYRSGARITGMATVKVPAGKSEVVFENLSPYFNGNSLSVKIAGNARLNSAVFQLNTPGPTPENPRVPVLRDSLVLLGDELIRLNNERETLEEQAALLRGNQARVATTVDGQKSTLTVAELRELATFYADQLGKIKERRLQVDILKRKLNEQQTRMQRDLQGLQPNTAGQTGEIVLKLESATAQSIDITCIYLVNNAAWTPLYDLRSAGLDKPLQLVYKANVRNSTGFDWKNVTLHLSTAQPLANNNRPILNPVFIDFRPVVVYRDQQKGLRADTNLYQMEQVNIAGSRSNATNYYIDGIRVGDLPAPEPETGEGDFLTEFDLPTPQDILADGKDNIVTVDEKDMPATYEYHAVPKLEPAVFLLAKVTDYGQFNLIPGQANIFFQDTYVGQTWVNPQTTADTLLLSLGRDEQITIKRVQPKDFTERRKIFNTKIKETYAFEISVKNNKAKAITVNLLDQVPISKQKDIVVELEDRGGAKYSEDFGKLEWQLEVPAGHTKKARFSYSVEYPKDKPVGYVKG